MKGRNSLICSKCNIEKLRTEFGKYEMSGNSKLFCLECEKKLPIRTIFKIKGNELEKKEKKRIRNLEAGQRFRDKKRCEQLGIEYINPVKIASEKKEKLVFKWEDYYEITEPDWYKKQG